MNLNEMEISLYEDNESALAAHTPEWKVCKCSKTRLMKCFGRISVK